MASRFVGRVAIVTGASRGIGEGILRVLAREGGSVVFCGLAAHAKLAAALQRTVPLPHVPRQRLVYVAEAHDLTQPGAARALVDAAISAFGRIDLVVNNAGWHPPAAPIDSFTRAEFERLLALNLIAPWELSQAALPALRAARGSIVNVSSVSGHFGQAGSATYCASKGGLVAMTKALAIDEAGAGVRVNSISPGNIWTPLWAEHVAGPGAQAAIDGGNALQALGRMGTAAEIGEIVLHLHEASFTTGIEYLATGGAELGYGVKAAPKATTAADGDAARPPAA